MLLQIEKWFGPQLDMILCCVLRGLLHLADHAFEAMQLESVQPYLRFFQRDGGTQARCTLGGPAREEVKV